MDKDRDQPALTDGGEDQKQEDRFANEPNAGSVRDDLSAITIQIRELVAAEMEYYQARLKYSKSVAKWTGLYLALAFCALLGSAVGLILGLLLILSAWFGPIIATVTVCGSFAVIGILLLLTARSNSRKLLFSEGDDQDG